MRGAAFELATQKRFEIYNCYDCDSIGVVSLAECVLVGCSSGSSVCQNDPLSWIQKALMHSYCALSLPQSYDEKYFMQFFYYAPGWDQILDTSTIELVSP
jgi:hypothetical protein